MLKRWLVALSMVLAGCSRNPPENKQCRENNGGCDPNAICVPFLDVHTCACKAAFFGDGLKCQPLVTVDSPAEGQIVNQAGLLLSGAVHGASKLTYVIDSDAPQDVEFSGDTFSTLVPVAEEEGVQHTVTVTAIGTESGHQASAARTYTVDSVAPICTAPLDGKRLISRATATTLFQCSKVMDVASLAAATSVDPNVDVQKLLISADGKTIQVASGVLDPYQIYTAILEVGAKDKAGNSIAARVTGHFLTEVVLPDTQVSIPIIVDISGGYSPKENNLALRLAVDSDGRPAILAITREGQNGQNVKALRWDGRGAWANSALPFDASVCPSGYHCRYYSSDFRINSKIGPDLSMNNEFEILVTVFRTDASGVWAYEYKYVHSNDFIRWTGLQGEVPDAIGTQNGLCLLYVPISQFLREYKTSASTAVLTYLLDADSSPPWLQIGIVRKLGQGMGWDTQASPLSAVSTSCLSLEGVAAIDWAGGQLYIMPAGMPVLPVSNVLGFYGAQQYMKETPSGYSPTGSSFIVWSESKSSATESYSAVYLACSATPSVSAPWKQSIDLTPVPVSERNTAEHVYSIKAALNESTLAVALSDNKGRVFIGTADNTNCASAPTSVTWSSPIPNADSPVVAVAPDGTVWNAWVDTVTKNVMIAHHKP